MTLYSITTLVETYDGNDAYSDAFVNKNDAEDYFKAEIEWLEEQYGITPDDETIERSHLSDGVVQLYKATIGDQYFSVIFKKCENK